MKNENSNIAEVSAEQKKKLKDLHGDKLRSLHLPTDDENENSGQKCGWPVSEVYSNRPEKSTGDFSKKHPQNF